jgi:hypothetical protein
MRLRSASAPARLLAATLVLGATLAGCGKSLPTVGRDSGGGVTTVPGAGALAASGLATRNTTRLGGASPVADAAAVALAVDPGLTPTTRPQAVVLVNEQDWPAALAAAALAGAPLNAPLLYSEGNTLPALSGAALAALKPSGSPLLNGAQVIEIGTSAAPRGYRVRSLHVPAPTSGSAAGGAAAGDEEAALAARIERLLEQARNGSLHRVIVVGAQGPRTLAMPAAGLAAESGTPILPVDATAIPPATRRVLASLHRPVIYAVGPPAAVSHAVLAKLARLGTTRRIYAASGALGEATPSPTPSQPADAGQAVANAIAVARYSDGSFGWGIEEPGHGLVFASPSRPLDAPAAAPLSASGDFGPLLLLEAPGTVPEALAAYLSDIKPSYPEYQPARGFYNHGWLIGDEAAIAVRTQAELDAMLETTPRAAANPPTAESGTPTAPSTATP